jgi:hypothetical protein
VAVLLTFPSQLCEYLRNLSFPSLDCLSLSEQEEWEIKLSYHMDRRFRSYGVLLILLLPYCAGMLILSQIETSFVPGRYSYIQLPILAAIALLYVSPTYLYLFAMLTTISTIPTFYLVNKVVVPLNSAATIDRYIALSALTVILIAIAIRIGTACTLLVEKVFCDSIIISDLLNILNKIEGLKKQPQAVDQRKKIVRLLLETSDLFQQTLPRRLQTSNREINLKLIQKFTGVAQYIRTITYEAIYPADPTNLEEITLILKQVVKIMLTANWRELPTLEEPPNPISSTRARWSRYAKGLGEQLVAPLPQTYRLLLQVIVPIIAVILLAREMRASVGDITSIASILAHG